MMDLAAFQFNASRSGEILKRWLAEARLSVAAAADLIGVTYDTLNNCLRGAVKAPALTIVFKICVLTNHTIDEYLALMLEGTGIDAGYSAAPSAPAGPAPVKDQPVDQAAVARYIEHLDAQTAAQVRFVADHYDAEINHIEAAHQQTIAHMEQDITKLERRCNRLMATLVVENICLAAVLVYDLFSHDAGWFRRSGLLRGLFNITKS